MFGKKYTEEYVDDLRSQIKQLEGKNKDATAEHQNEIRQIRFEHELEVKSLKAEIAEEIKKQTESTNKKLIEVEKENAVLNKELDVYTKAFENMGVDVKDMKEIMSELIKGIVSKNTVSVIK